MRLRARRLPIAFAVWALSSGRSAPAQQAAADRFDLHGRVVNSATGEPVAGALVEICCNSFAQFSRSDGTFTFSDQPRGTLTIRVTKPGYFSDTDLGRHGATADATVTLPSDAAFVARLTPEGILYGELKDESGEPLQGFQVIAGHRQARGTAGEFAQVASTTSDDEGAFRIAELKPGRYYLRFAPMTAGGVPFRSPDGPQPKRGYLSRFYPGASGVASATAIDVRPGVQIHMTQVMPLQRIYDVTGIVRGASSGNLGFTLTGADGEPVETTSRFDPGTGRFQLQGVPAGAYSLRASGTMRGAAEEALGFSPDVPVSVKGDVSGVVLTLLPASSLGARVRDEGPAAAVEHTVLIQLLGKSIAPYGQTLRVSSADSLSARPRLESIGPGRYVVKAYVDTQKAYVASMRCGIVDLLREDLVIGAGEALPDIEVTLRTDGARLNITVVGGQAGLVIYAADAPRASMAVHLGGTTTFSLAPGSYRLLMLDDSNFGDVDDPSVLALALAHGTELTLHPGENRSISLDAKDALGAEDEP